MKQCIFTAVILLALTSIHVSAPPSAEAYLDPGTGSYLLQIIIAGALSVLFMLKPLTSRIKLFAAKLFGKTKEEDQEDSIGE